MTFNENKFYNNLIYTLYLIIVFSLTSFHFGGWINFVNFYPNIADNKAYIFIVEKLSSLSNGEEYDMSHSIAIPGLGYLIFLIKKIFFNISDTYAYIFTSIIFYYLTLNIISSLFSSYISFIFLILGWEFVMTSTTGGVETVMCFLIALSIRYYLRNNIKSFLFLVSLACLFKPFAASIFGAYGLICLYNKNYIKILEIFIFFLGTIFLFFCLNYLLYDGNYLLVSDTYRTEAWMVNNKNYNYPFLTFIKAFFTNPQEYKIDFVLKVIFYMLIVLTSLVLCILNLNKILKDKKNEILFLSILIYFLIIIFYPSIYSYYEFVRFITPILPFSIYLVFSEFNLKNKFYLNKKIVVYFLLIFSSIFYSFANFGIKPSLLKYLNLSF